MTTSRWANWSRGTERKLGFGLFSEAAMPQHKGQGGGTPAEQAQQMGLVSNGYGWWKDPNTGQVVARTVGNELRIYDKQQAPAHQGNPTGAASGMDPADRARQMGLQSNGSGGYVDDAGNIAARTVNGELVFYDDGASGGAISDGSGGAALSQQAPSWVDPATGLLVVPPSAPETPEEIAAVPDPIPAQMPAGFAKFIVRAKKETYEKLAKEREIQAEVDKKEAEANEVYSQTPELQELKLEFDEVIKDAQAQGGDKAEKISYFQDDINDNAERYAEWTELLGDRDTEEKLDILVDYAIQKAKKAWWTDNVEPNIPEGPPEMRINPEIRKSEREHDIRYVGDYPIEVRGPLQKLTKDKINGLNEKTTDEFDKKKEWVSELTTWYTHETKIEPQSDLDVGPNDFTAQGEIESIANEILTDSGFGLTPTKLYEIGWDINDTDSEDPKRVALDSLSQWRSKVLPDLPIGMVLYSNTLDSEESRRGDIRERIYKLAGFGEYDWDINGQVGVVTMDEKGKKRVMPIDRAQKVEESYQANRIDEQLLSLLDNNLNNEERESLFSALFDGFI